MERKYIQGHGLVIMSTRESFFVILLFVSFAAMVAYFGFHYDVSQLNVVLFAVFGLLMFFVIFLLRSNPEKNTGIGKLVLLSHFVENRVARLFFVSFGFSLVASLILLVVSFFVFSTDAILSYVNDYLLVHIFVLTFFGVAMATLLNKR